MPIPMLFSTIRQSCNDAEMITRSHPTSSHTVKKCDKARLAALMMELDPASKARPRLPPCSIRLPRGPRHWTLLLPRPASLSLDSAADCEHRRPDPAAGVGPSSWMPGPYRLRCSIKSPRFCGADLHQVRRILTTTCFPLRLVAGASKARHRAPLPLQTAAASTPGQRRPGPCWDMDEQCVAVRAVELRGTCRSGPASPNRPDRLEE